MVMNFLWGYLIYIHQESTDMIYWILNLFKNLGEIFVKFKTGDKESQFISSLFMKEELV